MCAVSVTIVRWATPEKAVAGLPAAIAGDVLADRSWVTSDRSTSVLLLVSRRTVVSAELEGGFEEPGGFGVEHAGDRGLHFEGERGSQVGGGGTVEHSLHGLCGEWW